MCCPHGVVIVPAYIGLLKAMQHACYHAALKKRIAVGAAVRRVERLS